jgi:hypothetical protein
VINSDDGVISGTSGLKSSGGDDGNLVFQSKGTETARINTDKQIVAAAGTASLPALTTTGDVNTGIFFPAADTIAFAEGGAEAMRIDSSGNVLVGTTTGTGWKQRVVGNVKTLQLSNVETNNTDKYSIVSSAHYNNSTYTDGFTMIGSKSASGANELKIGGFFGESLAATLIQFYTAANATTTEGTERARITAAGYFKQSNTGSYISGGATQNEFNSNQDEAVLWINNTNASFATRAFGMVATRSANSAYHFGEWYSAAFGDKEFGFRGDGNAFADGTWSNNGADYAEFFESVNGQALTLGATVVLDGNKVREATEQDPASAVIGVVRPKEPSKASMIIGNTAWNKWANKYLTDDFDRYIMEDHDVVEWTDEEGKSHSYESQAIPEGITVPADATRKTHDDNGNKFQHYKLNPAWNPDSEYVNRENRPEWNIIGLLGQVKILKGQPVGDRWVKMRDVSDTVEEWFIR